MFSIYSLIKTQHSKNEDHGNWSDHFVANRRGNNGNKKKKKTNLQKLIVLISVLNCWIPWLKNIRDIYGCGVSVSLTHLDNFDLCVTKK